jgi:hypothetical protein
MTKRRPKIKHFNPVIEDYVRHLPRVPLNAPFEPGRFYHVCVLHDDWCNRFSCL